MTSAPIHPSFLGIHSIYVIEGPEALYVGLTKQPIENRWGGHIRDSRNGSNLALHRAIRTHGLGAFKLSVFAQVNGYFGARDVERSAISQFRRDGQRLYNADIGETIAKAMATRKARCGGVGKIVKPGVTDVQRLEHEVSRASAALTWSKRYGRDSARLLILQRKFDRLSASLQEAREAQRSASEAA